MDTIPDLCYHRDSAQSLDEFLAKHKPSMTRDDGTKPWICVQGAPWTPEGGKDSEIAVEKASGILKAATERILEIESDDSIPVRGKKGVKSKKATRDEVLSKAKAEIADVAREHKYTVGKWLCFREPSKIDSVFATFARSVVDGPLAKAGVRLVKVATSPISDVGEEYRHVICLYFSDVWDKDVARKILEASLRHCGISLTSVKPDLYTAIGLDSKHPSKMGSSIWTSMALMNKETSLGILDAYNAEHEVGVAVGRESEKGSKSKKRSRAPEENAEIERKAKILIQSKAEASKRVFDDVLLSSDENEVTSVGSSPKGKVKGDDSSSAAGESGGGSGAAVKFSSSENAERETGMKAHEKKKQKEEEEEKKTSRAASATKVDSSSGSETEPES